MKLKFISFYDDKDKLVEGYFEVIEENENSIKFKTAKNILTIPMHRICKIKEKIEEGENEGL